MEYIGKSPISSLEIRKNQSKTDIRKNTSVKKSNKLSETPTQSNLSINRKNPSVVEYAINQKSGMSTQEKQASYPESFVQYTITKKGPRELRNFVNFCYMNVIFQCLAEAVSS